MHLYSKNTLQTCFSNPSAFVKPLQHQFATPQTQPLTNPHHLSPKHSSFNSTYVLIMSQLAMKGSDTAPMLTALPVDQFLELPLRCTWRPQQSGSHGVVSESPHHSCHLVKLCHGLCHHTASPSPRLTRKVLRFLEPFGTHEAEY